MADNASQRTISHAPTLGSSRSPAPSPPTSSGAEFTISDPFRLCPPDIITCLTQQTRRATIALNASGEARVRLVDDAEMSAAHAKHLDDPTTTDVLTFDLAEGRSASGSPLDVDLLVCVDEARRQAAVRGHPLEQELLLYIVHGILHCLGHDDHDPAAAARMHAEEDRILETIGVGATYARTESGCSSPSCCCRGGAGKPVPETGASPAATTKEAC